MSSSYRLARIISGGQTGVDRGALDAAIAIGVPHGGHCPKDRRAEDGPVPPQYHLTECDTGHYAERTEQNVLSADATLILCRGPLRGGTRLTARLARRHGKPLLAVDLDSPPSRESIADWLATNLVSTLNVAGPRESQSPGIQERSYVYLTSLLV
jgi:hypothetical protein